MTARRLLASSALLAASVFVSPVAAQEISAAAIEADTRLLADDLLGGREAGTRGYDIAAAIVAARFAALGLTPAGDAAGWYQSVRLRRRTLEAADMEIATSMAA